MLPKHVGRGVMALERVVEMLSSCGALRSEPESVLPPFVRILPGAPCFTFPRITIQEFTSRVFFVPFSRLGIFIESVSRATARSREHLIPSRGIGEY